MFIELCFDRFLFFIGNADCLGFVELAGSVTSSKRLMVILKVAPRSLMKFKSLIKKTAPVCGYHFARCLNTQFKRHPAKHPYE